MTKKDLIKKLADATRLKQTQVSDVLDALAEAVKEEMVSGDGKAVLSGLASFSLAERAARYGRNPSTGAAIDIPAKTVVKVKALFGLEG